MRVIAVAAALAAVVQAPTFRAGVDVVAVDFLAFAKDGAAVRDLAADDLILKVDGRVRAVRSLQFIELARVADAGLVPKTPLPMPYGSNRLSEAGRAIVVAIDRDSIHPGQEGPIRSAVDHFLNRLTALDRVAIVTLPRSPIEVGLTRDRDRVHEALVKISGHAAQAPTDADKICRSRDTVFALQQLIASLAPIDTPKNVVFVSSGIVPPRQDFASFITKSTLVPLGTAPPERCDIKPDYFNAVSAAAADARAQLYIVQTELLRSEPGVTAADAAGLDSLAGVTGGEVLPLLPGEEALKRIDRQTAGYYLLGFEPDASERNGASHRIELRPAREHVTIRARSSFVIPKPRAQAARTSARDMLRDDGAYRDLPLHAVAYASRNGADARLKIVAVAEPFDAAETLASASIGLVDTKGRLVAQWTAQADELKMRPFAAALTASPGTYRVRVAAVDTAGRSGAADYEIDARLVDAGPVKLSALALGVVRGGQFAPALHFRDEEAAVAYFEIYGTPRAGTLTVSLDVSDAAGVSLGTLPARVLTTSDEDRRIATGVVPLGSLPPADYLVQATVGVDGRAGARVAATLRKVHP